MEIIVDGLKVHYEYTCREEVKHRTCLLFLHGWGGSVKSFQGVSDFFSLSRPVLSVDFAGFGGSCEPDRVFGIRDFCTQVQAVLEAERIERVHIVGHSFGGRAAICLTTAMPELVKKLVLVDSAGLKPKFSLKKKLKQMRYKRAKKRGKNLSKFGSLDYRTASDNMKKTLVKIVNENLTELLEKIKSPTLLIWGKNDKDTPLYMAKKMKKKIPDSGLIIFENAGHYSYLDEQESFVRILEKFLG
jgi:pimeloyl-ACP methyl ester carboxylesterase